MDMNLSSLVDHNGNSITFLLTKEYRELKDKEIRKTILEQKCSEMQLNVEKYVEEIRILKEEKRLLEETINLLKNRIQELENNNENLSNRVLMLEQEKDENAKLLKISQCVFDYKTIMKNKIVNGDEYFKNIDLFKILKGNYDNQLRKEELDIKIKMNDNINKLYGERNRSG
jgi:chromosome segregation ATPase